MRSPSFTRVVMLRDGMLHPLRHPRRTLVALGVNAALALTMSAATAAQTPADPKPAHTVNLTAKLKIKPQGGAFVGSGAATGTPFGKGRGRLRSTIKSRAPLTTSSTFTIVTTKGSAVFKGTGRYVGTTFKSTMRAFSGAGAYRGITASSLAVTVVSRSGIDTLRMKGTVRYGVAPAPTAP